MQNNNRTTLQFPELFTLWQFAQALSCKSIEIITSAKILICDCSADEIETAISRYGAAVLEGRLTGSSM